MAAGPATAESSMEARIARLESDVGHLRSDVTEIKVDVRNLRDRIDGSTAQLSAKIEHLAEQTNTRFEGVFDKMGEIKTSIAATRTWTLTILVTLAAAMFGTMARGFGWI